jgi:tRNA-binding protein
MSISWTDFEKINLRVGTIIVAEANSKAIRPSYRLLIDFGEKIGVKQSSAQLTALYTSDEIIGIQVIAVINFPPKQIANVISECLVLGVVNDDDSVVLLTTEKKVKNGLKIS